MKTNETKQIIYDFLKEKIFENYPEHFELMEDSRSEIFWGRLKTQSYDKVYITLSDKKIAKINKRFEEFEQNGKYYYKKTKQLLVTFGVYVLSSEEFFPNSDSITVDIIEFIENLFTEQQSTFNYFASKGIIINELGVSDIRDTSHLSPKCQEFRKEIDIPFEYEEVSEFSKEFGKDLEINIEKL